jgi:hypothetical protein
MLPPVTVLKHAMVGAKRKTRKNSRASALAQDKLWTSRIFLQPPSLRGMKAGSEKVENAVSQPGTKINGCNIASITGGRAFFSGLVEL